MKLSPLIPEAAFPEISDFVGNARYPESAGQMNRQAVLDSRSSSRGAAARRRLEGRGNERGGFRHD
jgi:hypothetical protein